LSGKNGGIDPAALSVLSGFLLPRQAREKFRKGSGIPIPLPIEFSRLSAGKQLKNRQLRFYSREFTTLKGMTTPKYNSTPEVDCVLSASPIKRYRLSSVAAKTQD